MFVNVSFCTLYEKKACAKTILRPFEERQLFLFYQKVYLCMQLDASIQLSTLEKHVAKEAIVHN